MRSRRSVTSRNQPVGLLGPSYRGFVTLLLLTFAILLGFPQDSQVSSLGLGNVFGVFKWNRRRMKKVQNKREQLASRKGFAGPSGEPLAANTHREQK